MKKDRLSWIEIDGRRFVFDFIAYETFKILTAGYGSHLSRYELLDSLDMDDYAVADRLFSLINENSPNISFDEYISFLSHANDKELIEYFNLFLDVINYPEPLSPIPDLLSPIQPLEPASPILVV